MRGCRSDSVDVVRLDSISRHKNAPRTCTCSLRTSKRFVRFVFVARSQRGHLNTSWSGPVRQFVAHIARSTSTTTRGSGESPNLQGTFRRKMPRFVQLLDPIHLGVKTLWGIYPLNWMIPLQFSYSLKIRIFGNSGWTSSFVVNSGRQVTVL